jgi:quinol monooxygenase YgiN
MSSALGCGSSRVEEYVVVTKALLVRLEALPGKESELAEFLTEAQSIVMAEPGTVAWFALRFSPSSFGIFDVFPDDDARDAHLAGGVGQALGPNTGVLFSEPQVEKIDIIAAKLPT